MTDEQARDKMEEYAEDRLRKAVRNYVEIDQNVKWAKTWVYTIDGERYEVYVKVWKEQRNDSYNCIERDGGGRGHSDYPIVEQD